MASISKGKLIIRNRLTSVGYQEKKDETVDHMITECNKLAQKKCKTRYHCVGNSDPLGIVQEIKI